MKHVKLPNYLKTFLIGILIVSVTQAQDVGLPGTTSYCFPNGKVPRAGKSDAAKSVVQNTTVFNTDYVSAGVGGLRTKASGQITLSGVSGTVTRAYLYWHGITTVPTDVGNPILVNAAPVLGTNIGVSETNCWGAGNSQAYRADVTALVQANGNGVYTLSGFGALNLNGASLIVFFDDGNVANNRDVVIFEGNDSNVAFAGIAGNPNAPPDPQGWNVTLTGINYTSGAANIQMHVADGQGPADDGIRINSAVLVPAGPIWSGNTVPGTDIIGANGNLWDIRTFPVTSFLSPGSNTLNLTSGLGGDCLGLIVALIDLPAGAAPPADCTITPKCKSATVSLVNGTATLLPGDVDNGSTASCGIKSLSVSPNSFSCADVGPRTVTLTVTANDNSTATCTATVTVQDIEPPTAKCKNATVNLSGGTATIAAADVNDGSSDACGIKSITVSPNTFNCTNAGANTVTLTVTDNNDNTATCTATVTVLGGPVSCSIASVPTDDTYTGGNPNVLYLGYGAQSTTLQVAPSSGVTYSWSPSTGLSSTTSSAPVFTPPSAGTFTFTVTVTSPGGCSSTCSITICVLDVRVPGTGGKKVYVCHYPPDNPANYNTLAVSVNAVQSHIAPAPIGHGDKLGTCEQAQTPCTSSARINPVVSLGKPLIADQGGQLVVSAMPNPSANEFKVMVQSKRNDPITISVSNVFGKVVYAKANVTPNTHLSLGSGFPQGTYYVEIRQGTAVTYGKLLKTK